MIDIGMMLKNEEEYLDFCIKNNGLENKRYVVVDTGSNDSTLSILEKHNIAYSEYPFTNYKDVRNRIISEASGEYLLMLDGDETIADKDIYFCNDKKDLKAYSITRCNYLGNGCLYFDRITRLLVMKYGVRYVNTIYECVDAGIEETGHIDNMIHHFGFLKKNFMGKADHNLAIIDDIIDRGEERSVNFSMKALYLLLKGDIRGAQEAIDIGRTKFGNVWFYILQADIFRSQGNYISAVRVLDEADEFINKEVCIKDQLFFKSRVNAKRGINYLHMNELQLAVDTFNKIDKSLDYCRLLNLKAAYTKMGCAEKAKEMVDKIDECQFEKQRLQRVSLRGDLISDIYNETCLT